jgi:hypothetical protein
LRIKAKTIFKHLTIKKILTELFLYKNVKDLMKKKDKKIGNVYLPGGTNDELAITTPSSKPPFLDDESIPFKFIEFISFDSL